MQHLKIHLPIEELSNCTDTNYDSSIGKWYINVHNEPYCYIPHFHIINEDLKFDSRILLFESKYLGNKFHQYDLSEQQRIFINKWLSNDHLGVTGWKYMANAWEEGDNNIDNWKDPDEFEKPDYTNII